MATEVRTGLVFGMSDSKKDKYVALIDSSYLRKSIRQHIKEFACIFAILGLLYAGYSWYYLGSLYSFAISIFASVVLLVLGYGYPLALYPIWKAWMGLAHILSFIITGIIISAMWLIVFIPLALFLNLIGKRVMDLSFDRSCDSYWLERDSKMHDFKLLERQF